MNEIYFFESKSSIKNKLQKLEEAPVGQILTAADQADKADQAFCFLSFLNFGTVRMSAQVCLEMSPKIVYLSFCVFAFLNFWLFVFLYFCLFAEHPFKKQSQRLVTFKTFNWSDEEVTLPPLIEVGKLHEIQSAEKGYLDLSEFKLINACSAETDEAKEEIPFDTLTVSQVQKHELEFFNLVSELSPEGLTELTGLPTRPEQSTISI